VVEHVDTRQIEQWRTSHFSVFAGAKLDFRVPLTERLINDYVTASVLPRVPALRSMRIRIDGDNRLTITAASSRLSWLPQVSVPVTIESDVVLNPTPVLRLQIAGTGLAGILAPLTRFVKAWPQGVRVTDRLIELDFARFLPPLDAETLALWLRRARVTTTPGTLWIECLLSLPHDGRPADASASLD
jgi:hypothetical protein